ncbi:MAG TPA: nitrilase-related carbon-nitrogen hydrolase, partial [Nitrospiraceae bacterium]|nr:nitrilase-related carbon-nitrogen hydrolase [Nitrospiraceae bacterium]
MRTFRVAMAQINPTVGDLDGNLQAVMSGVKEARKAKADLVAFPELALTGYPPEDLLLKPRFIEDTRRALETLIPECRGLAVVV